MPKYTVQEINVIDIFNNIDWSLTILLITNAVSKIRNRIRILLLEPSQADTLLL